MAKRKKRNAITLVSLLLALSALIGVYVWYSNRTPATDDSSSDSEKITLATLDTTKVTNIHFIGSDVDIKFTMKDGAWVSDSEPERPINQDNVNSMLKVISTIDAVRSVIEAPDDLSEYGLDKPFAYIQATQEDGSTVTLQLGDEAINQDGYYALVNDDTTVYLVTINYGSGLGFNNLDFTEIEEAPTITAANITYLGIDKRDGEDVELQYNDYAKLDNSGSVTNNWQILKPYGEGYTADSTKISELQANYTTFDYMDCVDYKGDDLSKYGLDDPFALVDIGYYEESAAPTGTASSDDTSAADNTLKTSKEYKIFIGNQNDDGDYYVRSDGSNNVYTLSASTVDKMLNVDVFSFINPYISMADINSVDKITADIAGNEYVMDISRKETKNDDGDTETTATYKFNNSDVEESNFKSIYMALLTPQYTGELTEEVDTKALTPVFTVSYHITGDNEQTITTSYLPYNDNFYIVDKGTGKYFTVDKRVIDDITAAIESFSGK